MSRTILFAAALMAAGMAQANEKRAFAGFYPAYFDPYDGADYEVSVTNLTRGQSFTPILVVSHKSGLDLFEAGEAASAELVSIAEAGNLDPLKTQLTGNDAVVDMGDSGGLLGPGESVTVTVSATGAQRVSLLSMLIPTNDSFIGLDGVQGPRGIKPGTYYLQAYDAGSEPNDELCAHIPGPVCGGEGLSESTDGEGFVHVSVGISGHGDLQPQAYDWRNPVAKVSIKRVLD